MMNPCINYAELASTMQYAVVFTELLSWGKASLSEVTVT